MQLRRDSIVLSQNSRQICFEVFDKKFFNKIYDLWLVSHDWWINFREKLLLSTIESHLKCTRGSTLQLNHPKREFELKRHHFQLCNFIKRYSSIYVVESIMQSMWNLISSYIIIFITIWSDNEFQVVL